MDIFCKIINNEIPAYKLYEDDEILMFLDINPNSNGHTLIVPKKHYVDLEDIDPEVFKKMIIKAKEVKKISEEVLHCDGITIVQNSGCVEEVKHFHIHVIPKYKEKQEIKDPKEIYEILKRA